MINSVRKIKIEQHSWPMAKEFRISRSTRTETKVVKLSIIQDQFTGSAEVVPQPRYNESIESVTHQIKELSNEIEKGLSIEELQNKLTAGAARNAIDCALWDLKAKLENKSVAQLNGLKEFGGCITAQTISLDTINKMAEEAVLYKDYPLIKIKLNNEQVIEKIKAIHQAAPNSQFIVDANEAWNIDELNQFAPHLKNCNAVLIEQPLKEKDDQALQNYTGSVMLCADESIHTSHQINRISKLYGCINIKLDKTGGLTESLNLLNAAREHNLSVMVGCMVGSSLAMAPASLVSSYADFVDLDGPELLASDVKFGFNYKNGLMSSLNRKLWGFPT